jgi:sugar porter (SP) family MFS transporter
MTSSRSAVFLLVRSALTGALGGLLFGFDTAVIAGATHGLTQQFHLSSWTQGVTVSIALWGTVVGALSSGYLGQKIGSRAALRVLGVLYVISALGCAFAPSWGIFLGARFIGGLGIGGSSVLGPVYIAELAPAKWRGRMVGLFQINIVVGILLAYLSNAVVAHFNLGLVEWRYDLAVAAVPAILFLILLLSVPHSSRWLVSQNRIDEALLTLTRMGSPDSRAELDAIVASLAEEGGAHAIPLFDRRHSRLIFLAVTIGMFNQLTGINAILYYLNDIFASAGFGTMSANLQAVAIGLANLVATLLGISLIDRLGRKTLLLVGAVGCGICLAGVAAVFHAGTHQALLLPLLVGFIIFFAISQGAVIWVYISEIFPTPIRAQGQSLGSSTHWIMNGIITLLFPVAARYSKSLPFAFFALMMVVQFVVVLALYPETKGYSLEALQRKLLHGEV